MSARPTQPGTFIISLDFELMWGMFDKVTIETYGENLRGVHTTLPKTLELFSQYNVHATWATVGMLMCKDSTEFKDSFPEQQPQYERPELSAYNLPLRSIERFPDCYFAPKLVQQIVDTPGQELASHTFAHYYALEVGADVRSFKADCLAMQKTAERFGVSLHSLVFPRNQWSQSALETIASLGFTSYRGTEDHFIYRARSEAGKTNLLLRALRFLDRYYNLTGHHTYSVLANKKLTNLPASRQLHPHPLKALVARMAQASSY